VLPAPANLLQLPPWRLPRLTLHYHSGLFCVPPQADITTAQHIYRKQTTRRTQTTHRTQITPGISLSTMITHANRVFVLTWLDPANEQTIVRVRATHLWGDFSVYFCEIGGIQLGHAFVNLKRVPRSIPK